ncbi:helix-turn-helix domain-containing protein [Candidatus Shapirobacteria bacterium]|nr:helix-turn-helix domain-containing protein [Candidatus Shapirobacteria bacterium]
MAKTELRTEARKWRSIGESIKVIAKKLHVSPSTVSFWCKDIKLSLPQIKELERRAHDPNYGKRLENSLRQQRARIEKTKRLFNEGVTQVGRLTERELFIAGIALYWAEGFKSDSLAGFCNTDPDMVKFFLSWLKKCFGYKNDDFRLRVGLNESFQENAKQIENFWANLTGISKNQFQKPFYQKVKWKKEYEHPENYHGVLRIRIKKSTDFLRKIKGYIEGFRLNSAGLPAGRQG